ncbi:MAG: MoxR family ATPase [Candidatus Altiarchaeota archaeon]
MALEKDKDVFQQFSRIINEVHKVIIGNDDIIEGVLISLFCGGHILLESVPGMGKTVLANTIAKTIDCDFKRVQCTNDLTPTELLGESIYDEEEAKYLLRKGPVFTNLLLIDEINRAPPLTQSALLEVMEEKTATFRGVSYKLPQPFIVIATQNPVEQVGTNPLPEAQKDRFLLKLDLEYLSKEDELSILKSKSHHEEVQKVFTPAEALIIKDEIAANVTISETLLDYVTKIVRATRERREVWTGASPRAEIAFMNTGKARAFLHGRDHVTVEDIQYLAYPILRHRIILDPNVRDYGTTTDEVIEKVLSQIEAP